MSELFLITIYICFDSGSAIALYSILSLFFRFKILPVCMIVCLVRHPVVVSFTSDHHLHTLMIISPSLNQTNISVHYNVYHKQYMVYNEFKSN